MVDQPPICVVDDDESVRRSLDGLLRSTGYRVVLFADADTALLSEAVRLARCVISDINMPGEIDGLGLAKRLQAEAPQLKVILISAFLDGKIEDQARGLGVYAVLRKPFDVTKLLALVESAMSPQP